MNVRHGIAAAALLSLSALTVACGTSIAGSAAPASTVSTTSASSSASTTAPATGSTTAPTTSSPSSSVTHSSPAPSSEQSTSGDDSTVTIVVEPAALDATTAVWLHTSCTDITALFASLFAIPTVDETAPVEDFRAAYVGYYASLADTLLGMTDRLSVLDPPTVEGGQALHDGYLNYLIQLADITASGALAISDAPADVDSVGAVVEQIQFETEQLSEVDLGLSDFQGDQLQELMSQVPACQQLLNT